MILLVVPSYRQGTELSGQNHSSSKLAPNCTLTLPHRSQERLRRRFTLKKTVSLQEEGTAVKRMEKDMQVTKLRLHEESAEAR